MSEYAGRQFVGIDLHRRRTVLVRTTESGEVLEAIRILNDVDSLNSVMARAGGDPEVVLEATYGWYWAVDALQAAGAQVHLAHPLGVKAFEYRRVSRVPGDDENSAHLRRAARRENPNDPRQLQIVRQTGPAPRPYGRFAVGLRPSLDPDPYLGAPSKDVGARRNASQIS